MRDGAVYGPVLLGLYALGARPAAAQLHARVLAARGLPEPVAYLGVLGAVSAWGLLALGTGWWLPAGAAAWAGAVAAGVAAGLAAPHLERALLRRVGPRRPRPVARPAGGTVGPGWGPGTLVAVAVLEEVVYRGVLTQLALSAATPALAAGVLAASAFVFAASHHPFGFEQVLAKLGLSALTVATVLAAGCVLPAAIAHALFNARASREAVVAA